jgi:hypothetical protein
MRINMMAMVQQPSDSLPNQPEQAAPLDRIYLNDLEAPVELAEVIERTWARLDARREPERRRIAEDLKLQYHFGGKDVAYVAMPRGRLLVAAGAMGSESFSRALARLSPQERRLVVFCTPLPWNEPASYLLDGSGS